MRALFALPLVAAAAWATLPVHADPQPALDRQLVERLVRAQESQAHALEGIQRAVERAGDRCR
jgi:hypothetical protein